MKQVLKLIDGGNENRIRKATLGLKTPLVTLFPRSELNKFEKEEFSKYPGVYILYNEVSSGEQSIYVGEAESIYERMCQHDKNMGKAFWTNTIIMQDRSSTLNKAHFKYLEYMFYTYVVNAKRCCVINKVIPTKSSLSLEDEVAAEEFIDVIKEIFVLLNIRFLEPKVIGRFEEDQDIYYLFYNGAEAKMRIQNRNKMTVLSGSIGVYPSKCEPEFQNTKDKITMLLKAKKAELIPETILVTYKEDIEFDSENEACAFLTFSDIDGSEAWKDIDGVSLFSKPYQIKTK